MRDPINRLREIEELLRQAYMLAEQHQSEPDAFDLARSIARASIKAENLLRREQLIYDIDRMKMNVAAAKDGKQILS